MTLPRYTFKLIHFGDFLYALGGKATSDKTSDILPLLTKCERYSF